MNDIICGDCLEVMKGMGEDSVDAIVTDPPYGIDYQSAWRTDRSQWKPKIKNDKRPFIWWLYDAFRVIKDGGALLCFCRWDTEGIFRMAIETAGFTVKSQVIWDRGTHGMGDLKGAFAPQHDTIWFATKGKFAFPGKRPKSVIQSQRVSAQKLTHPNEKPIALMSELVKAVTPPGGTVLDPFAGSGSTLLAARQEGFSFVGIEREQKYCDIIRERLATL